MVGSNPGDCEGVSIENGAAILVAGASIFRARQIMQRSDPRSARRVTEIEPLFGWKMRVNPGWRSAPGTSMRSGLAQTNAGFSVTPICVINAQPELGLFSSGS